MLKQFVTLLEFVWLVTSTMSTQISAVDLRNAVNKMKQPINFETNVLEKCTPTSNTYHNVLTS